MTVISTILRLVLSIAVALPVGLEAKDLTPGPEEPELSVLSFGRVNQDAIVDQSIHFENPYDRTITVESIQLTPPLIAREIPGTVPPRSAASFRLILGENRTGGGFNGVVRINFRETFTQPIEFRVEGFIIPDLEFVPRPLIRVGARSGETATQSIDIINHRQEALLLQPLEQSSDRYRLFLSTISAGHHYRLTIELDGNATPGRQEETIELQANPPLDTALRVQVQTLIRARVYHFPEEVNMGSIPHSTATNPEAKAQLAQTLMVYRLENDDFEAEVSTDLDFIEVSSERGPNGDRYQMTLTLLPDKVRPGPIDGEVILRTNDAEFSELRVPVTGNILPPH